MAVGFGGSCESNEDCGIDDDVSMFQKIKTRKGFKAMVEPSEAELLEEEPEDEATEAAASLAGGQVQSGGPKTATVKLGSERRPHQEDRRQEDMKRAPLA